MIKIKGNSLITPDGAEEDFGPVVHEFNFPGVLFYDQFKMIFQTPPQNRIIEYTYTPGGYESVKYDLVLPWAVYMVNYFDGIISSITVLFSRRQISNLRSIDLYYLPLPNIYNDQHNYQFCMPKDAFMVDGPADIARQTLDILWGSTFNNDLHDRGTAAIRHGSLSFVDYDDYSPFFKDLAAEDDLLYFWEKNVTFDNIDCLFEMAEGANFALHQFLEDVPVGSTKRIMQLMQG